MVYEQEFRKILKEMQRSCMNEEEEEEYIQMMIHLWGRYIDRKITEGIEKGYSVEVQLEAMLSMINSINTVPLQKYAATD